MSVLYVFFISISLLFIFGILGWILKFIFYVIKILAEGAFNFIGYIILGILIILLLAVII